MFIVYIHQSALFIFAVYCVQSIVATSLVPTISEAVKVDSLNTSSSSATATRGARSSNDAPSADARSGDLWYLEQSVPWPPMPYSFGYEVRDPYGNEQYRRETGDSTGAVNGAYSYWGPDGIYRQVDYVADENGFRAKIKTSEPGTSSENPADVLIQSNPVSSIPLPYIARPPPPSSPPFVAPIAPPPLSSSYRTPESDINRRVSPDYNRNTPSTTVVNNNSPPYGRNDGVDSRVRSEGRTTQENQWPRSPSFDAPPRRESVYDEPAGLSYGGFGVRTSLPPTTTQRPLSKMNHDGPRRSTRIFSKTNRDRYNHPMKTNTFDFNSNNVTPPPPVRSSKGRNYGGERFLPQDVQVTDGTNTPPTQSRIRTTRQMSHDTSVVVMSPSPITTFESLPEASRMARKPSDLFFMKDQINNQSSGVTSGTSGHSRVEERVLTHSIYVNTRGGGEEPTTRPSVHRTEDPISGVMYEESHADHRDSVGNHVKPPPSLHYSWSPVESSSLAPTFNVDATAKSNSDRNSVTFSSLSHNLPGLSSDKRSNASSQLHPLPLLPKFYRTGLLEVPAPPTESPVQRLANLKLQLPPGTGDPATIATSTTTAAPAIKTTTLVPSTSGRLAFDENRPAYYSSYKETHHSPPQSSGEDDSANDFSSSRYISVSENGHTVLYPARPISYQYHRQVVSLKPRKMVSGLFTTRTPKKYSPALTMNSYDEQKHFYHLADTISKLPLENGRAEAKLIDSTENSAVDLLVGQSHSQASMKSNNGTDKSVEQNESTERSTEATTETLTNEGTVDKSGDNISSGVIVNSNESTGVLDPTGDIGYASEDDVDTSEGEVTDSDDLLDETSTEDTLSNGLEANDVASNVTETNHASPVSAPLVQQVNPLETHDSNIGSARDSDLHQAAIEDEETDLSSEDLWV